jgi:hypothetical protein
MALSSLPASPRSNKKLGIWTDKERSMLVNWEPTWEAAKMIRSNPNNVKMAEESEKRVRVRVTQSLRKALCPPLA